jgi:tricarballylate dehydrogenase
MSKSPHRLVVVGHGAAGLAAALTAAETARRRDFPVEVTLVEKAPEESAGGNTLWSPSYMRLAAPDRIAPDFQRDMLEASNGRAHRLYFDALANNATATVGWLATHGVEFCSPAYYLSAGPLRIAPVGGGRAIVGALSRAAKRLGITVQYRCPAQRLVVAPNGQVSGLVVASGDTTETMPADAVILATGGFQANRDMMHRHFGPGDQSIRLLAPRAHHNAGDGIRMGLEHGARISGDWNGMHAEPVDPRAENAAPVVLVYPYGIVVDQNGRRFVDEGGGLVHEMWEWFARKIHFETPGGKAYAILDSRLFDIAGFERAIRSEVPPYQADTLDELARLIGVDASRLAETVGNYNAAAIGDPARFDATRCDGLAASSALRPPKSNWARAIVKPPFLAYPLIGAIAYTFGGLATNAKAEVLGNDGPLAGLYAAGEMTGHFYGTAPNAVAVLRALVFGRIAGLEAVSYLEHTAADRT